LYDTLRRGGNAFFRQVDRRVGLRLRNTHFVLALGASAEPARHRVLDGELGVTVRALKVDHEAPGVSKVEATRSNSAGAPAAKYNTTKIRRFGQLFSFGFQVDSVIL
jgi:hypothetical protein